MMCVAPIDTSTMKRVGGQLGSNPAGIYENESGQRFYVKSLESPEHARNEFLAAQLYQLAGAPTLSYVPTKAPDQIATELIQLDKKHVSRFNEQERKQAQQWLGVHAWTANWDAAGFDGDNQGVVNGVVLTLDVGGALAFRAHGDLKGPAFGTQVDEIKVLRQDPRNAHARWLFGDMDDEAVARAVEVVTRMPDALVSETILNNGGSLTLVDKMLARKANMADCQLRYGQFNDRSSRRKTYANDPKGAHKN